MQLPNIIAIIILNYMKRSLKTNEQIAQWKGIIVGFIVLCSITMGLSFVKGTGSLAAWLGFLYLAVIAYLIFTEPIFRLQKSLFYATLPLTAVFFVEQSIDLVSPSLGKEWDNYFDIAGLVALIWTIVMLVANNKQRKAREKQEAIAEQKEKEYRQSEEIKAQLEVQVKERTAELTQQTEELQHALNELKATQTQLIQSEKMASLGELTAGIAHEIKNPLNFVNNFSELSNELIEELKVERAKPTNERDEQLENEILNDIAGNLEKINHHGKRADSIVKGMLQHSRSSTGQKEPVDINNLCDEYLRLAYHGLRAKDKSFNAKFETDFDPSIKEINVVPQEIGRVILNLVTNAFYTVNQRLKEGIADYEPTVIIRTKGYTNKMEIIIEDNGQGMTSEVLEKMFQPFFTTKPTGEGTGLGLSMSYDIVTKGHSGQLTAKSIPGKGTIFTISLPYNQPLTA